MAVFSTWYLSVLNLLILILLSGCTSTSLFMPYPAQIQPMLKQVDQGTTPSLESLKMDGANGTLHLLEAGRLAQIQGDREASIRYFSQALDDISKAERKALLSLQDTGELGGAMMINDNALTYDVTFFERAMAHAFQALNYLYLRDLEGAGVEARRANLVDVALTDAYQKKLAAAQAKQEDAEDNNATSILESRLHAMNQRAAQVKAGYASAYGYFISGLVYELRGEYNAAYIDYKKALALNPDNPLLLQTSLRWATHLGFRDDADALSDLLSRQRPANQQGVDVIATDQAEVIVLYEQQWVSAKQEESLYFEVSDNLVSVALPVYQSFIEPSPLLVGEPLSAQQTWLMTDFQALAAKALKDQHSLTLARQIARAAAKNELQDRAEKHAGTVGLIAAFIYTAVSESADLRSWLSLPAYAHAARLRLPAGDHVLDLSDPQSGHSAKVPLTLKPGEKAVLQVINTGTRFYIHHTQNHSSPGVTP